MFATICLIISAIMFFLHGAGIGSYTVGSVTLHTIGFGLFFLVIAALVGAPWPWRKG
jgi:hypothetical protein